MGFLSRSLVCATGLARARSVGRALPWLVGAGCVAPFIGLILPNGRTLPDGPSRDFIAYQLPVHAYAREEILKGHFPLWIPYLAAGLPLHAAQQASLCHPLVTPLTLMAGAGYGLKLSLWFHLLAGFIGMYLLARQHLISRMASCFSALTTCWAGFLVNHLMAGHLPLVLEFCVIPWFFLSLGALLRRPGAAAAISLSACAGLLALSGHPQVFYYTLLFGGLWAAGSFVRGRAWRHRIRCACWGVFAAISGALVSSVQLLPSLELVREGVPESYRAHADFSGQLALTGLDLIRLIAPDVAGNPFTGRWGRDVGDTFHERVMYVGLIAPLLVLYRLSRRRTARWEWGASWLVLLALAIALGHATPVFRLLVALLPGLGLFRCPGRALGPAVILMALVSGRGLDSLIRREPAAKGARWLAPMTILSAAGALCGFALAHDRCEIDWQGIVALAFTDHLVETTVSIAISATVLAALLLAWHAPARGRSAVYVVVIATAFLDLAWNNVGNFRLALPRGTALPESLTALGAETRFVEGPALPEISPSRLRYSQLVGAALQARRQLLGTNEGGVLPAATERLFRAVRANPRVVLAVAACDCSCIHADGHCESLGQALPRFRFHAQDDARLLSVPIESIDDAQLRDLRECMVGEISVDRETSDTVVVDADVPCAGRLLMADNWYPGWRATVDGEDTTIEQAHGVFRGVQLGAGRHRVVFSYQPTSFRLGIAGTLCGLVLWFAVAIFARRLSTGQRES